MAGALVIQPLTDLWLDDLREPEAIWPLVQPILWVKDARAAIDAIATGLVRWASLDHDLGVIKTRDKNDMTGYSVTCWMAEHDVWPREGVIVHSHNPVGADRMCGVIIRYGPYRPLRRPAQSVGPPGWLGYIDLEDSAGE